MAQPKTELWHNPKQNYDTTQNRTMARSSGKQEGQLRTRHDTKTEL